MNIQVGSTIGDAQSVPELKVGQALPPANLFVFQHPTSRPERAAINPEETLS